MTHALRGRTRYSGTIDIKLHKPWFLDGNVSPSICVSAFLPKRAINYETSKINLHNPGTYDLIAPVSEVSWSINTGWIFSANRSYYFDTGYVPTPTSSYIVQFDGATATSTAYNLMGYLGESKEIHMSSRGFSDLARFMNFSSAYTSGYTLTSGIMAMAGGSYYHNGTPIEKVATGSGSVTGTLHLGKQNRVGNTNDYPFYGNIKAFAIYSSILTDEQILKISNRLINN